MKESAYHHFLDICSDQRYRMTLGFVQSTPSLDQKLLNEEMAGQQDDDDNDKTQAAAGNPERAS